MYVGML